MNGRMDGWIDRWAFIDEWADRIINEEMKSLWMDRLMDKQVLMDKRAGGQTETNKRMDMDG